MVRVRVGVGVRTGPDESPGDKVEEGGVGPTPGSHSGDDYAATFVVACDDSGVAFYCC